ncbi:MAG: sulfurtransferase TusA family protein [Candidatus Nanopelagicales bacterium]|jgi:tRNA 2-thiouridine synthesizing protein A|nr:sulfurtransferase TusA family protein [Candidatus Nanopelagicales bacterium]
MTTLVEARGVLCPVPIIRLARAAAGLPPGSLVALCTDDPAAEHDVPAWCRLRGHELLSSEPVAGAPAAAAAPAGDEPHAPNPQPGQALRHLIRLAGPPADAAGSAAPSTGGSASAADSSRR